MLHSALATLTLALAGTAVAAPPAPPPSIDIPVRESDLADPASIAALRTRIARAARDVCRTHFSGDLLQSYTLSHCIETSRERALDELDRLLERRAAGEAGTDTGRSGR